MPPFIYVPGGFYYKSSIEILVGTVTRAFTKTSTKYFSPRLLTALMNNIKALKVAGP